MFRATTTLVGMIALVGCSGLYSRTDAGASDSGVDAGFDAGLTCDAGFHDCSGSCVLNDLGHCGPSCNACVPPANASPICTGSSCDFFCAMPLLKCGSRCCKAVEVSAGGVHTCALTELGTIQCWGFGPGIGDGTSGEHLQPENIVVGGDAGVVQLSTSYFNTCARLASGSLRCWGNNAYGSVGDGTTLQRAEPVEVFGQGVTDIAFGAFTGCAVVDGGAQCWGSGTTGQLGDGANMDRSSPGSVSGLLFGVQRIWASSNTVCAGVDGGFLCWGANSTGECGDRTSIHPRAIPVVVTAVDAGILELHPAELGNCALTPARGVKCFGGNTNGAAGTGNLFGPNLTSVDALGMGSNVTQLTSGSTSRHYCAVRDGGAYCWGLNDKGQVGDQTTVDKHAPTPVYGLSAGVKFIATGEKHTCAVTTAGGVKCWGHNDHGQLGDGTKQDRFIPVDAR